MRVIEARERVGRCSKCNSTFAYTEKDIHPEFENNDLYVMQKNYLVCPCCKARLLESQHKAR